MRLLALTLVLLVAGCATRPPAGTQAPPAAVPPQPPVALAPINSNLSALEQAWHLRAGLNVAALSCVDRVGAAIVSDYNAMLARHRAELARAYDAKVAAFQSAHGAQWQRALDTHMTQLYNHFAWPPAQEEFCRESASVARATLAQAVGELSGYAAAGLPRIDGPIVMTRHPQLAAARAAPAALARGPAPLAAARAEVAVPLGAPPAGWEVQLGAFSSRAAAERSWAAMKERSPQLATYQPRFPLAPGGRLVRVRVGSFADRIDAVALCAHASAAGYDCVPATR